MTQTPLVAIVFDDEGNVSVRVAGSVRVVWVDERAPEDRTFETLEREPMADLEAFVGEIVGHSGDDRQKRLEIQLANRNGPALRLVEPGDA